MRKSCLKSGGKNLFQLIKQWTDEAIVAGVDITKLSIGQSQGPALWSARWAASNAVKSKKESMHEYQDNKDIGVPGFSQMFVQFHLRMDISGRDDVAFLPIPGIKSMLGLIPLACGARDGINVKVATTTKPGYPTPRDWCRYLLVGHEDIEFNLELPFVFFERGISEGTNLIMMNYPGNPGSQIASQRWLHELCAFCEKNNIRLFNDGAYEALDHSGNHYCLLLFIAGKTDSCGKRRK